MRATQTVSAISDKLRETAADTSEHLAAAGDTVNQGLHEAAGVAADGIRQSARSAEAALHDATAAGKDIYKGAVDRAGMSLASIDRFAARNPLGALAAALGLGLVLGLLARK